MPAQQHAGAVIDFHCCAGRTWLQHDLQRLLPSLVQLLTSAPQASVRRAVLEALQSLTALPYEHLHGYRQTALRALRAALDDNKRAVRTAAVACHSSWTSV